MTMYDDRPGIVSSTHPGAPEARVAKSITPTYGDRRYAHISHIQISDDDGSRGELVAEGPEQAEFDNHLISFLQDETWFVGSCVRCGRRYQIRLKCLTDAESHHIGALRAYIMGWFLEHDCDYDAMNSAVDALKKYAGCPDSYKIRQEMEKEANEAIAKTAVEKGAIETYE